MRGESPNRMATGLRKRNYMTISRGAVTRRIIVAAAAVAAMAAPAVAAAPTANAAGTVVSAVSLSAPGAAAYGSPITLSGVVWRYGTTVRIAGAPVVLQRSVHGANRWANYKSTRSASNGAFAFSVTQTLAYDYRAFFPGSTVYRAATSAVRYPIVIQKVFLDGVATTDYDTGMLRAVGRVFPTPPSGSLVYLQRYDAASKTYKSFTSTRTTGSATVVFNARVGASTGWYRIYAPTRGAYAAGASVGKVFTHYVWRGAFKRVIATSGDFVVSTDPDDELGWGDATAAVSGSAAGTVNTSGCVRLGTAGLNFETEPARLAVTAGDSTTLRWTNIPGATEDELGEVPVTTHPLGGATKVTARLTDLGGTQPMDASVLLFALCSN
jgi:hypothetical protein